MIKHFSALPIVSALLFIALLLFLGTGCAHAPTTTGSSVSTAAATATTNPVLKRALADVKKVGGDVITDIESPAGRALLKSVATGALELTADVADKNGVGGVVDGGEALAGTLEAYSALPTTVAHLSQITAAASGVVATDTSLAPAVASLVKLAASKVKGPTAITAVIQAAAQGIDTFAATAK